MRPRRLERSVALRPWLATSSAIPSRLAATSLPLTPARSAPFNENSRRSTFDAAAECDWTADSGTYYYTTETYRDSNGKTRTRQVRHTRWRPAAGSVSHFFDDQPVPGTRGIDRKLLHRIQPFPTTDLVPYDTAFLSGFVVEHYQVVLIDAAKSAREAMDRQLYGMCAAAVPGDTHRNLQIHPLTGFDQ